MAGRARQARVVTPDGGQPDLEAAGGDRTALLIARLARAGRTVAVAESLTGGGVLAELTRPAGASAVVLGGLIVYATELKHTLAGVDAGLLRERGPVDPDVACQLAAGVRQRCAVAGRPADVGIATTGVAGPDPQGGRPPGTVYLGLADAHGAHAVGLRLTGTRAQIRQAVIERAVAELGAFAAGE